MAKLLMKGNEAISEAAIKAGCRAFFGYPITPQNEMLEYMAIKLPEVGGVFVQSESELAAINMVYGAAGAGVRAMTSSSSPGIALKQEGITYLAGAELPSVIVSVSRGGPGLGGIQPSQADYNQATKGGGNGDYKTIVFAPNNIQEACDYVQYSFEVADKYRNPVILLLDGTLAQMMEPVEIKEPAPTLIDKSSWAATGDHSTRGKKNIVNSLHLNPLELEKHNLHLQTKYELVEKKEQKFENYLIEDASIIVVAYGISSRIAKSAVDKCRQDNLKVGMIRPISLYPFPNKAFENLPSSCNKILVVELSLGQMLVDVKLAVCNRAEVLFYGRTGGVIFTDQEIAEKISSISKVGV